MGVQSTGYAYAELGTGSNKLALTTTSTACNSAWHFYVLQFGSYGANFYFDGNLVASSTTPVNSASPVYTYPWDIGSYSPANANPWIGEVDEVDAFSGALYSGSSFTLPTAADVGTEANLLADYHLDGNGNDSSSFSGISFTPDNANIYCSKDNWFIDATNHLAKTINGGAYCKTSFTGSTLYLNFTYSQNTSPYFPEVYAIVDGQLVFSGSVNQNSGSIPITLPANAPVSTTAFPHHSLELDVKGISAGSNRWTGSQPASLIWNGVTLASGNTLAAPTVAACNLDVYGDSITEGEWALGNHAGYTSGTQDADYYDGTVGIGGMIRRQTGCEVSVIGFGRQGWAYTGVPDVPAFPSTYGYLWSGQARTVDPSVTGVVIAQGTNDVNDSAGSCASVASTMASTMPAFATAYAGKPIAVLEPTSGTGACSAQVKAGAAALGLSQVTYVDTTGFFTQTESTDSYTLKLHPTAAEELTHMGPAIGAAVKTALNPTVTSLQHPGFFH